MTLTRIHLGDYIKFIDIRNIDNNVKNVMGISVKKVFREPTSKVDKNELTNYKIIAPNQFGCVPTTHNERCFAFAYNDGKESIVISPINYVFEITDETMIHPRWLQLYFNRPEFDRYARFNSWGTAREVFSDVEIKNIVIDIPPLPIQRKYVTIYEAMLANQKNYEKGLDDLKLTCDAFIEDLRRKMPCEKIGKYIKRYDIRNGANGTKNVMGVSIAKEFREPSSKVNKNELANYKVCHPGDIAFVQTTNNEKCFANALNNTDEDIVVTSVDEVFTTEKDKLFPEYLVMFFNRKEFDRYARFHSWGSARETFTWSDLVEVQIPIPDIKIQKSIANIYKVYTQRKAINEKLKAQIRDICPILIKGSLEA